ncbi:MAG: hypothetical protein KDD60_11070, partial [Bdellovibrionales bacterium]|nr:hypothetical protein [Bdellovibrionales bacterium]
SSLATSTAVPLPVLFPLLMLGLVFSQLAGTLLAGWFLAVAPQSLILSLTGVIDPELAQLQSEPKSASEGKKHKTPQGSKSLLHASDVQLRALGSSSGALLFLFGLYHSPLREILVSGSSISSYLWGYGAFLTISPFLPPHRMTESFKHGLREAALPLFVFLAISLLGATFAAQESPFLNSLSHSLSLEHLFLFALAVIGRQFWWSRLKLLSSFAQQITLRHAMIPMENVTCFSHGDTIEGAQLKALRSSQEIFPVLSGNRLTGVVQKEVLFRTSQQDEFDDEFISAIADPVRSYAAPDTMLEVCFGPEVHLPIFVLDDSELTGSEITGMVTAAQIRDSLLVALSGNRSFRSRNGLKDSQDSGTSE